MAAKELVIDNELLQQYMSITGASDEFAARNMLEACNGDLQMSVNMFLEAHGGQNQVETQSFGESSNFTSTSTGSRLQPISRPEQFDEEEDSVRAPIPQQQGILVDDSYYGAPQHRRKRATNSSNVFDHFRDFQKETEEQEKELEKKQRNPNLKDGKRKRLQDLFRPPIDIMHQGDFNSAKLACTTRKKWLLVNVQKSTEFSCQVLNRDVWSNQAVRDILQENFTLWQVNYDSEEGEHYALFYSITRYPHLAVIDPRTGERMIVWESFGSKPSADQFSELATNFLVQHLDSSLVENEIPSSSSKSRNRDSVINLSEEVQLRAAMAASLQQNPVSSMDTPPISDSEESAGDEDEDTTEKPSSSKTVQDSLEPPAKKLRPSLEAEKTKSDMCTKSTESSKVSDPNAPKVSILLRCPDGGRKQIDVTTDSSVADLLQEIASMGWPSVKFEFIRSFPRTNLSSLLDLSQTLDKIGFHKQETVFIQER